MLFVLSASRKLLLRVSRSLPVKVQNASYTLLPSSMPSSIPQSDFHDDSSEGRTADMPTIDADTLDAEFGGSEARKQLEKKLLLKLDTRMSILVVIYILNYVIASSHFVPDSTF